MEITSHIPSSNSTTQGQASAAAAAADFETFLTLLTAQMRNQDPLKPLESTEFVAQLANFSAVEQQVRTNDTLGQIQALLSSQSASGLSSWIGQSVRVESEVNFEGTPIDTYLAPAHGADRAELVVKNASGEEVQRLPTPLEAGIYPWAGVGDDGTPIPAGQYSLSLESFSAGVLSDSHVAPVYSEVKEARLEGDKTMLVLTSGSIIGSDQVTAIRG